MHALYDFAGLLCNVFTIGALVTFHRWLKLTSERVSDLERVMMLVPHMLSVAAKTGRTPDLAQVLDVLRPPPAKPAKSSN